jgi:hypothetical protein
MIVRVEIDLYKCKHALSHIRRMNARRERRREEKRREG